MYLDHSPEPGRGSERVIVITPEDISKFNQQIIEDAVEMARSGDCITVDDPKLPPDSALTMVMGN